MEPIDATTIRKLCEHSTLDAADLDAIRALTKTPKLFRNKAGLVSEGEVPTFSIVVLKGMVARYKTVGATRQYLSFHLAGDWPDAQTLFIERMDHGVCALGEVLVAFIPHDEILEMFKTNANAGFAIWRETLIDGAIFRRPLRASGAGRC